MYFFVLLPFIFLFLVYYFENKILYSVRGNDMIRRHLEDGLLASKTNDNRGVSLEIYRLYTFRSKNFLKELLIALDENITGWMHVVDEAARFSMQLMYLKRGMGATLGEITLSAFWHILQTRGINKFSINRLIKISREKLKKRILYRRVLKILSHIRLMELNFSIYREVVNIILTTIPKLINDKTVIDKYRARNKSAELFCYVEDLRRVAIKIANEIPQNTISGKSRRVIAAICIYVADKILSKEYGIKPILSAKLLENYLGVSQFTILRRYKNIYKTLIDTGMLDEQRIESL